MEEDHQMEYLEIFSKSNALAIAYEEFLGSKHGYFVQSPHRDVDDLPRDLVLVRDLERNSELTCWLQKLRVEQYLRCQL